MHLQERLVTCDECGECIDMRRVTKEQHSKIHHNSQQITYTKFLNFVIFRPGPGHIEMTMAKAILKFLWKPCLEYFSKLLGFRTARAQEVVKAGIDHHRSKQIIGSLLEAIASELVLMYVRSSLHQTAKNLVALAIWIGFKIV